MSPLELTTELEATWREKVKQARVADANASECALVAVENCVRGIGPDAVHKLQVASQLQADARVELARVLKILADLTERGKIPE
jgi:hypothetical protein